MCTRPHQQLVRPVSRLVPGHVSQIILFPAGACSQQTAAVVTVLFPAGLQAIQADLDKDVSASALSACAALLKAGGIPEPQSGLMAAIGQVHTLQHCGMDGAFALSACAALLKAGARQPVPEPFGTSPASWLPSARCACADSPTISCTHFQVSMYEADLDKDVSASALSACAALLKAGGQTTCPRALWGESGLMTAIGQGRMFLFYTSTPCSKAWTCISTAA